MSAVHRLLCSVLAAIVVVLGAWFGVRHYGAERHRVGYAAAVAAGKEAQEAAAIAALAIE